LQIEESSGVRLTHVSPDGDEGFPGQLALNVIYSLNNENELKIEYSANSTKDTPVNLTNHSYWNLSGAFPTGQNVLDHELTLHCNQYLPVNETLIPTGSLAEVEGSPMDFQVPYSIGARIADVSGGYDHCFVVNKTDGELRLVASVFEPTSGRVMTVATTEPSVQFYTGNFLDGSAACGNFAKHFGFCLECQHFPDSANQPQFPSTILEPGQCYSQTTVHAFSVR
jgi:aldose 1-epimerase